MELTNTDKYLYNSFNHNTQNIDINELIHKFNNINVNLDKIDISSDFPKIYDQGNMGITSSCAIVSIMSYYLKKDYNIDKLFSPYYLAYYQYQVTKNWESIDLFTGLNISNNFGICSDYLFDKDTEFNELNINLINDDANKYRSGQFSKINFNISNIEKLLNDGIPILCSIKIIPSINNKYIEQSTFYNNFNNYNYWTNVYEYYKNHEDIYSVSIIIVGYNSNDGIIKIRGCWGDQVGQNGYFFINYDIINLFSNLFFDQYIIEYIIPTINHSNNLNFIMNDIIINNNYTNEEIIQLDTITPKSNQISKKKSFNKISSLSSFNDTMIHIESYDDLNNMYSEFINEMNDSNDLISVN